MIFCINWDLVFEVRVANDSTSLPRSAPGQLGMVPAPTVRVNPTTLSGPGRSGMAVIDDDILGSTGSWKMLEKMSHLKKQLIFRLI